MISRKRKNAIPHRLKDTKRLDAVRDNAPLHIGKPRCRDLLSQPKLGGGRQVIIHGAIVMTKIGTPHHHIFGIEMIAVRMRDETAPDRIPVESESLGMP